MDPSCPDGSDTDTNVPGASVAEEGAVATPILRQRLITWMFGPAIDPFASDANLPEGSTSRLGILHLLVLTACVAVSLSLSKFLLQSLGQGEFTGVQAALHAFRAIGAGATMAGLLLWIARRRRGLSFPVYPGEYLAVAHGVITVTWLFGCCLAVGTGASFEQIWFRVYFMAAIGGGLMFYAALARLTIKRWRVFFQFKLVVLGMVLCCHGFGGYRGSTMLFLLEPLVTAVAVLMLGMILWIDHRQRKHVPWTHWLGVVMVFGFAILDWASVVANAIQYPTLFSDSLQAILSWFL